MKKKLMIIMMVLSCAIMLSSAGAAHALAVSKSSSDGKTTVIGNYSQTALGYSARAIGINNTDTTYSMLVQVKTAKTVGGKKSVADSNQNSVPRRGELATRFTTVSRFIWGYSTIYATNTSTASVRIR